MRIAQVSPLFESVPPAAYGGTERVVANLTDELVRLGHDVTLFASGDSRTSATLVPICPRPLRLDPTCLEHLAWHVLLVERVAATATKFDLIHFHIGHIHLPVMRRLATPYVMTMHGRLDGPELGPLFEEFSETPLVSISDAQRAPLPQANWIETIHHGLPADHLAPVWEPGGYLAFLGRISPEKRLDRAIAIADALGQPLKVAAKVDPVDNLYFTRVIEPLLKNPLVEFVGEIGDADKNAFLGNARALLFPIDWPEPFGLVMIESLACGTPVIAFRCGSVDEILDHGRTGFVVNTLDEAIDAAGRVDTLDRRACRLSFERRFTARRMAEDYVSVFERIISGKGAHAAA